MPDQYEIGEQDGKTSVKATSDDKGLTKIEPVLSLDQRNQEIDQGNGTNFSKIAETEIKCHKKKIQDSTNHPIMDDDKTIEEIQMDTIRCGGNFFVITTGIIENGSLMLSIHKSESGKKNPGPRIFETQIQSFKYVINSKFWVQNCQFIYYYENRMKTQRAKDTNKDVD